MKGGAGVSAMPQKKRPKNHQQAQLGLGADGTDYTSGQLEEITALIDPQQFHSMTQKDSGLMICKVVLALEKPPSPCIELPGSLLTIQKNTKQNESASLFILRHWFATSDVFYQR